MGWNVRCLYVFLLTIFLVTFVGGKPLLAQRFVTQEQGACHKIDQGEIDEAIEILEKILKANPDNLNAHLYLGIAYYLKKDIQKSSDELKMVEGKLDKLVGSSRPFGDEAMFTQMGMDRKSDILFSRKREGLLYFCRGLTLKEEKDFKNAENRFKKALKNKYDEKATRLQLFDVYIKMKDMKKASKEVKEIKKIAEDMTSLSFLEGYLAYREGSVQEALSAFEKVASSNLTAKKNVALIHYNSGDYQKAIGIWEEILAEQTDDKESLINIGRAYFHLGNGEKAQECFTDAGIKLTPERYSPKKIPLSYESQAGDLKFDLMCEIK